MTTILVRGLPGWLPPRPPGKHIVSRGGPAGYSLHDEREGPATWSAGDHVIVRSPERAAAILAGDAVPWVVVERPGELLAVRTSGARAWLRGIEAGGRTAGYGSLSLIRAAGAAGVPWAVEGAPLALAGALQAVGAAAIILGASTWLCATSPLAPHWRRLMQEGPTRTLLDTESVSVFLAQPARQLARLLDSHDPAVWSELCSLWWTRTDAVAPAPGDRDAASRFAGRTVADVIEAVLAAPIPHPAEPEAIYDGISLSDTAPLPDGATLIRSREATRGLDEAPALHRWVQAVQDLSDQEPGLLMLEGGLGDRLAVRLALASLEPLQRLGWRIAIRLTTAALATHDALEQGLVTRREQSVLIASTPPRVVSNGRRQTRTLPLPDDDPNITPRPIGEGAVLIQSVTSWSALCDRLLGQRARSRWLRVRDAVGEPGNETARAAATVSLTRRIGGGGAEPLAIVGLGCHLPDAPSVRTFWSHLVRGHDAVQRIPAERWSDSVYWRADGERLDRTYSRIAGVAPALTFDPKTFRIPPRQLPSVDASQKLALVLARQAIEDAMWSTVDGATAGVVIGNVMGGELSNDLAVRVRYPEVLEALRDIGATEALSDAVDSAIAQRLDATVCTPTIDSMAGSLSNVIAGRVAAWLDWMGGNLTVDAACAASLAAVAVAADWLRSGRAEAVLTGGLDTNLTPEAFAGFCATRALSTGHSRPFSEGADGFVMGEGGALFAVERLSTALAAGRPVWAVIRGIGQSSDGRSKAITAPRPEGQRLAIERAWRDAGISPREAGLWEAHGTGTAAGDRVEMSEIRHALERASGPVWVGSIKSMVGHLKGGAGAAGLLKTVLALATGVVPPTLHAAPLNRELRLGDTRIRLPRHATPLHRKIAGVSAFGFGGTNVHMVVTAPPPEARVPSIVADLRQMARPHVVTDPDAASWNAPEPKRHRALWCFGAPDRAALARAVRERTPLDPSRAADAAHRLVAITDEAGLDAAEVALESPGRHPGVYIGSGAAAADGPPPGPCSAERAAHWLALGHPGPANRLPAALRGPYRPPVPRAAHAIPSRPDVTPHPMAEPPRPATEVAPQPASPREAVLHAIAEQTGYPIEVLEPQADLEADLGIDSIRKMEILSSLQGEYGFTVDESDYAALAEMNVESLVRYVTERVTDTRAPTPAPAHMAPSGAISRALPLDPSDQWLADHSIGGRPLVPAAHWIRTMLGSVDDHVGTWTLTDLQILAPTFVSANREDLTLRLLPEPDGYAAEIHSARSLVARAMLRNDPQSDSTLEIPPSLSQRATVRYSAETLFHGPSWQVLETVHHDGNGRLGAALLPGGVDPISEAIDGIHQLLATWSGHRVGRLALPVGAKSWEVYGELPDHPLSVYASARLVDAQISGDAVAIDPATGEVLVRGRDIRLRPAATWPSNIPHPFRESPS